MDNTNFGGTFETGDSETHSFEYKDSKIVILPIPFDLSSSWRKGADKGPEAIIQASNNLEFYDIETNSEVFKLGIFTEKGINAKSSEDMISKTEKKVHQLIKDSKFVVSLGGDHSVSIPLIKAHSESYKNLSILHLDAHTDSRDTYHGNKYSHACVIARAKELKLNVVSAGIRAMDASEPRHENIFYAENIYNKTDWINSAVKKLTENVYVTIDVDVFDPSIIPGTGTPEPGGLSWYSVLNLLKEVADKKNIVGFDVVELCPLENKVSDFTAAKLIYKLLSYKFGRKIK